MFAGTIFCIVMIYFLWRWKLRLAYIEYLYKRGDSKFELPREIDREELMYIVDIKLNYPAKAGVHINEDGEVELLGIHGDYSFSLSRNHVNVIAEFPEEQRTLMESIE